MSIFKIYKRRININSRAMVIAGKKAERGVISLIFMILGIVNTFFRTKFIL